MGADFRIKDAQVFGAVVQKFPHTCEDVLKEAVYGLTELNRDAVKRARVVANPGCYPTTMKGLYLG